MQSSIRLALRNLQSLIFSKFITEISTTSLDLKIDETVDVENILFSPTEESEECFARLRSSFLACTLPS